MVEVEPWQVIGTLAAVVFGTVGATVTVTKLVWDRRDRRRAAALEADEAARLAHERERRRREQAQWESADRAEEDGRRLRIYSEAEARQFLASGERQVPTMTLPQERRHASRARVGWVVMAALVLVAALATLVWLVAR